MGRPIKIAKAQAVLTITGTTATTNIVTVSQNLSAPPTGVGVIAGMPFVVATNVGGLVAATDYWVLTVLSSSTFTVSATAPSANPTSTPVTLTTTTGQTIAATVASTNNYFNNPTSGNAAGWPANNSNTYSVVGGNTSIYGNQVLANVAIGQTGVGTLYSAGTANTSAVLYGQGSNLANQLSTGSAISIGIANINGLQTDYTSVGFASSSFGQTKVVVANTNATGNVIGTSGNAQTLGNNQPVIFDTTFAGITANTTYFVKTIANASALTISTTQGGPPLALTTTTTAANAIQDTVTLTSNALSVFNNSPFIFSTAEAGFIVRQKGKSKYLVHGATSNLTAQVYTANVANAALTPNTFNIQATYANAGTAYISTLSDHNAKVFSYVTAGSFVTGAEYKIRSVGTTDFTLIGASSNTPGVQFFATGAGTGTGTATYLQGETVTAGSFVVGQTYTILTLGTTSWTAIGATANTVGVTFTATGVGTGTGTASLVNYPLVIASFNAATGPNVSNAQPAPIVTINNS